MIVYYSQKSNRYRRWLPSYFPSVALIRILWNINKQTFHVFADYFLPSFQWNCFSWKKKTLFSFNLSVSFGKSRGEGGYRPNPFRGGYGRFFGLTPPPHLPGIFSLASYFPLKHLAFETPRPLRISNDLPWGGYGYFLELHIAYLKHINLNVLP